MYQVPVFGCIHGGFHFKHIFHGRNNSLDPEFEALREHSFTPMQHCSGDTKRKIMRGLAPDFLFESIFRSRYEACNIVFFHSAYLLAQGYKATEVQDIFLYYDFDI